ncbi:MAG TPA: UDP-N-acetylmuramoyl-tripeptide--D-alanyl-D-alanine ligase [Chloroflexota bacterium]|nr:UDP-N-acetylmuramoyl-tripeptide--D-alanyl-D-alanine ligase [Chloroflexota bacterium]
MKLDVATVLAGTGAEAFRVEPDGSLTANNLSPTDFSREFRSVCVDSRTVEEGDLFVALRGERTDGHRFVGAAFGAAARGCLVSDLPEAGTLSVDTRGYLFRAPDALRALQRLARHWRDRHDVEVIGVTGSVGKTTTKEVIAAVLGFRWRVLKNAGNLNTEIGLPLTLLDLDRRHELAVLEMGMYGPGEIATLAAMARPRIGVVTMVAPVHLERLGSIERIARAKSELVAALPASGLAVLNGDDPWARAMAATSGIARSILVGLGPESDYRAERVGAEGLDFISFDLAAGGERRAFRAPVAGRHLVHAFLTSIAIGRELGMSWDELQASVSEARIAARQRLIRDRPNMLIIDDSYNAAPASMVAALDLLQAGSGSKIAVLGDMLELGPEEGPAHRLVGARAAAADWLVTRGVRAAWIREAALEAGLPAGRIIDAESNEAAAAAIESIVARSPVAPALAGTHTIRSTAASSPAPEWTVLVKGSRGMRMEEIVERLRVEQ